MEQFFTELENRYGFRLLCGPERLSGGFTHKMYALRTTNGDYAIKLLNPFVMKRETAMSNYAAADELEEMLKAHGIPIIPSLAFNGRKMQDINGQYFYLFDYFDGKALTYKEITGYHCSEMGKVLAAIHNIDKKETGTEKGPKHTDWKFYISEMKKENTELYELLRENYPVILKSQENGNLAIKKLPRSSAVCHNDMDSKNVLWKGNEYRIIDLECLSYNAPMSELFELALCWSGYEECAINFSLFRAFIEGYASAGGTLPDNWEVLYDCNNGRLEWLEYNIKRVLGIDCGEDEKETGLGQVRETLKHIVYYDRVRNDILSNCENI